MTAWGITGIAAVCLLALAGCAPPPALRTAEEVEITLAAACAHAGGTAIMAEDTRLVDPSGFSVVLAGHGWCRVHADGLTGYIMRALSPEEIAARGGRLTPAERAHSAFIAVVALTRAEHESALRSPAAMRRALEAAARPGGQDAAGERLLPLQPGGRFRVETVEIGAARPDGCVPALTVMEERGNPTMPPGTVLRLRDERRYCVGPGGRGAMILFSERFEASDPGAPARSARLRALAERVFDSLRFEAR